MLRHAAKHTPPRDPTCGSRARAIRDSSRISCPAVVGRLRSLAYCCRAASLSVARAAPLVHVEQWQFGHVATRTLNSAARRCARCCRRRAPTQYTDRSRRHALLPRNSRVLAARRASRTLVLHRYLLRFDVLHVPRFAVSCTACCGCQFAYVVHAASFLPRGARATPYTMPPNGVFLPGVAKGERRWGAVPRPNGLSDYASPAQRGPRRERDRDAHTSSLPMIVVLL